MRKKLFAVIMSAMMMITFMPAMAFAAILDPDTPATVVDGWKVSGFTGAVGHEDGDLYRAYFIYDGQEHTVTLTPSTTDKTWKTVAYTVSKKDTNGKWTTPTTFNAATAPVVKDAGIYLIRGEVMYMSGNTTTNLATTLILTVARRPVTVANNTLAQTKSYDAKPYVLSDADLTIGGYTGNISKTATATGWYLLPQLTATVHVDASGNPSFDFGTTFTPTSYKYDYTVWEWDDWNKASTAWKTAHSGLVGSDKLIVGEVKTTSANVGKYHLAVTPAVVNPNYYVVSQNTGAFDVEITQAKNVAKIASNTLVIKKGASKAVKFSTAFGTAKLEKVSTGNTKISVKNGKVKVAKNCKKGTYTIKVKCSAVGNANYTDAARTKALKIKVK